MPFYIIILYISIKVSDYSPAYAEKTASKEFFYLDTSRSAVEREFEVSGTNQLAKRRATYNKGFALRKALLGTSSTVNTGIPLNRYSFFEMLQDELLPNTRVEMSFENEYPEIHYTPTTDMTRVYGDVLRYVHKGNEYGEGSLLNRANFSTLFPFLYFDLTKQKMEIKDGTTKLTFKYEPSGTTATAYSVYALTLYEQDVELIQKNGKILLRS